jgi:4-amino-4-deoxy-L-arabinose transferase-like glycosyltransferase
MTRSWRSLGIGLAPYLVLGVVAAVPCFYLLGERGLWGDEVWTVWWSQLFSWRVTFQHFNMPPDLPLPMLLIKAAEIAGRNEFLDRLPSALCGVGSVFLLFHVARPRLGRPTAISAGLLLAVAPLHVWYAQEARPYAALEFLSLLSLVFFLRLLDRPDAIAVTGLAIANALNAYNHLFGLFPWVVELAVGFGLIAARWVGRTPGRADAPSRSRIVRALALATAGSLVLIIPIVPGLVNYAIGQESGATSSVVVDVRFVSDLLAGFGAGYSWPIILFTGLAVLGAGTSIAGRQPIGITAVAWIVLPIVALALFAPAHGFVNRYVMFMVPVYLLLVAHGAVAIASAVVNAVERLNIRRVPRPVFVAAPLVALLLALMLPVTAGGQMASRGTDWSGMCEYLKAHAAPGDTIIGTQYYQPAIAWCYGPGISVADPEAGRYSPDDLYAAGRPSWYIHIGTSQPDPALARLGYEEIPLDRIERPGTRHDDITRSFPYRISEAGSRLFRGPPVQPVAAVRFQDIDGDKIVLGWPDHATVFGGARYVVALALATDGPRHLRLSYLAGPDRITVVRMNGSEIARMPATAVDAWTEAEIPLPADSPEVVTLELEAAGELSSSFSAAELAAGPASSE